MSYKEFMATAKKHYGTANTALKELEITRSAIQKAAERNNGVVPKKYTYMLIGLIASYSPS